MGEITLSRLLKSDTPRFHFSYLGAKGKPDDRPPDTLIVRRESWPEFASRFRFDPALARCLETPMLEFGDEEGTTRP